MRRCLALNATDCSERNPVELGANETTREFDWEIGWNEARPVFLSGKLNYGDSRLSVSDCGYGCETEGVRAGTCFARPFVLPMWCQLDKMLWIFEAMSVSSCCVIVCCLKILSLVAISNALDLIILHYAVAAITYTAIFEPIISPVCFSLLLLFFSCSLEIVIFWDFCAKTATLATCHSHSRTFLSVCA